MINFGHGVILAPVVRKQLGQLLVWRNDARIWRWCRQNSVISESRHEEWFNSLGARKDVRMFSIVEADGKVVGVCGLTEIDENNRRAEFSLYVGPEFHKRGYGKRALKTLVDHAFIDLNLVKVWGETFDGNPAAKMFESLGFKSEGVRRSHYYRNGRYIDATIYSILKGEQPWWKQEQSSSQE
jgi:UDP-4-amino-4,6-dideoxy-N-acetyl-beta-L-altrosamine N-acetyltransferase